MPAQALGHTMDLFQLESGMQRQCQAAAMQPFGNGKGRLRLEVTAQVTGHRAWTCFNAFGSEVVNNGWPVDGLGQQYHQGLPSVLGILSWKPNSVAAFQLL